MDDSLDFIGWYTDRIHSKLGISKWDPKRLYIAYHEGIGGYRGGQWRNDRHLLQAAATVISGRASMGLSSRGASSVTRSTLRSRGVGMIVCASFAGATRCHRSCLARRRGVYRFEWVSLSRHSRLSARWSTIANEIDLAGRMTRPPSPPADQPAEGRLPTLMRRSRLSAGGQPSRPRTATSPGSGYLRRTRGHLLHAPMGSATMQDNAPASRHLPRYCAS